MYQITDKDYFFGTTPPENQQENCETIRKNEGRVRSQPQTGGGARVKSRPGTEGGGGRGGGGGDPALPGGQENGAAPHQETRVTKNMRTDLQMGMQREVLKFQGMEMVMILFMRMTVTRLTAVSMNNQLYFGNMLLT